MRLQRIGEHPGDRVLQRFATRAGYSLPLVEVYKSPDGAGDRFGGNFWVKVYVDEDMRDRGVPDESLYWYWGPNDFGIDVIEGSASRANVHVDFFCQPAPQMTPEAEATWVLLVSCLKRLSPNPVEADPAEPDDSWTSTGLWVLTALSLAIWRWRKARHP